VSGTTSIATVTGRLAEKAIIVFGSARGIGAATVRRLAAEGARICAADLDREGAEAIAASVREAGGECRGVRVDIADEASVSDAVAFAVERLGGLDGAHINAADLKVIADDSDVLDELLATFDRTLDVNLRGHLLCTRAVLPHLLARGEGAIVYTSSDAAELGEAVRPAYAASKGGLNALMRHVARRWGPEGVTANCVAPGFVHTPEARESGSMPAHRVADQLSRIPGRRVGRVEDIAGVVALLLSEDGRWINGQVYHVNGGALMH